MRNIPINLSGYKIKVVESPIMKMKQGTNEPVTAYDGTIQFVVSLFFKPQPEPGKQAGKGEEIRVTLTADPGDGFTEDTVVELIDPTVSAYSMKTEDGRDLSGISFKAAGLKPAVTASVRSIA
jgi:hypothetical protein